jgi:hypothetical protein
LLLPLNCYIYSMLVRLNYGKHSIILLPTRISFSFLSIVLATAPEYIRNNNFYNFLFCITIYFFRLFFSYFTGANMVLRHYFFAPSLLLCCYSPNFSLFLSLSLSMIIYHRTIISFCAWKLCRAVRIKYDDNVLFYSFCCWLQFRKNFILLSSIQLRMIYGGNKVEWKFITRIIVHIWVRVYVYQQPVQMSVHNDWNYAKENTL